MAKRVLIVDDNEIMRQALCRLFKAAGDFRVCGEAADGAEAINLAASLNPDLVVLDLCMPGMNGLETAKELKKQISDTKILLYSMNAEELLSKEAAKAGVAALVSKAEGMKSFISKARTALTNPAA